MNSTDTRQVRVQAIRYEAAHILSYELRPEGVGQSPELPNFTAGSHIDVHLPNGLKRSYSILNSEHERDRYVIAVKEDPSSRGGSRYLHKTVRAGDLLTISTPRNNFDLDESASHTVLFAGGIGITPLWSMIQRLHALGRSWELYYCVRTRGDAAFASDIDRLADRDDARVHMNYDGEAGGKPLDFNEVLAKVPATAHLYCCGPTPMLAAFRAAAEGRPSSHIHVEYFAAEDAPVLSGGFTVTLVRSKKEVIVPAGKSILDALLDEGVDIPYSCKEGVCGACETGVLEGIPDHRDTVLSEQERAGNRTMMICCSGCKNDRLLLDL